jgi:sugar phosphate isomerase/epimerase
MDIVTTTGVFPPSYQAEEVLERLAGVGFTALDAGFDYFIGGDRLLAVDNWRERVIALRKRADALGVRFTHAHAPFNVASEDVQQYRALEAAALLGAKFIVVHPIHEIDGRIIVDVEEFIRVNVEATQKLLPYAEKYDLILLSENILWQASVHPKNIVRLVKEVNSPRFGWCYDTGHAHFYGIDPPILRELDVMPLSLHIQDTHGPGYGDEHLIPGYGNIDWKEFLEILHEVGYTGELVLEAHHQSYEAPDEQKDGILAELLERAKKMNAYYDRIALA